MSIPDPIKRIPERIDKALRHPAVVAMTIKFGVNVGHEAYRLQANEITYAEFKRKTIAHIGEVSGTTLGAAIGGLAGSWMPGVGALVGAILGSMIGEHVGRKSALQVHTVWKRGEAPIEPVVDLSHRARRL